MVGASLILLHTLLGIFCFFQTLHTIKSINGRISRFDVLMTVFMSSLPFSNIGLIIHNLFYINWDWWNKEI